MWIGYLDISREKCLRIILQVYSTAHGKFNAGMLVQWCPNRILQWKYINFPLQFLLVCCTLQVYIFTLHVLFSLYAKTLVLMWMDTKVTCTEPGEAELNSSVLLKYNIAIRLSDQSLTI